MKRFVMISVKHFVTLAAVIAIATLATSSAWATNLSPFALTGYDADVMYGVDGGVGGGYCVNPAYKSNAFAFFADGAIDTSSNQYTGGLPTGSFTSAQDSTNTYLLAYAGGVTQSDNALSVQGAIGATGNSGTLTLAAAGKYDQIGVLACTFEGSNAFRADRGNASSDLAVTLNFSDNSTWSTTYHAWDWCDTSHGSEVGFNCSGGRAYGTYSLDGNFTNVDSAHCPNLYETVIDIPVAYQSKNLSSVTFYGVCGTPATEHYITDCGMLVFAVSGHAVPEPGTLALLACGLVGLLAYAWRKRK